MHNQFNYSILLAAVELQVLLVVYKHFLGSTRLDIGLMYRPPLGGSLQTMKALKCKPSAQFAYNYTINVLSKCSNIISHRSSVFEGRHNDHRSSKVGTSIIHLRRSTHLSSILEGRHTDHRSSKVDTSIFEDRRRKHRTDNPTSHRQFVTEYCPQRRSMVIPKIPRSMYINIRRRYTHPYTYIRQQPHTCTSYVLYAYLYCVYALVGGAISIRDPYICAVLRICANGLHTIFYGPVV